MVTAFKQTGGHPEQCFTNHYSVTAAYQERGTIVLVENKVFRENCTLSQVLQKCGLYLFVGLFIAYSSTDKNRGWES